jgi:plastocyanin
MSAFTLLVLGLCLLGWVQPGQTAQKDFYIVTVHVDGKTSTQGDGSHPPEPFPGQALPSGGGIVAKAPDAQGEWSMRAFVFEPSQVIVYQGDQINLHFLGVQGPSHTIAVDGQAEPLVVKRGEMKTVSVLADKVGSIGFRAVNRQPTMHGQVLVLPRP